MIALAIWIALAPPQVGVCYGIADQPTRVWIRHDIERQREDDIMAKFVWFLQANE